MRSVPVGLGCAAALYAAFVVAGPRGEATAAARFLPDLVRLLRRLLRDPAVPTSSKVVIGATIAYLVCPIDVVPDPIPVAGQLDDVVIALAALRWALRRVGPATIRASWPGPESSLALLLRTLGHGGGDA